MLISMLTITWDWDATFSHVGIYFLVKMCMRLINAKHIRLGVKITHFNFYVDEHMRLRCHV